MAGSDSAPRSMRVLVTGAAGFLGSHLCERLADEGHGVWGLDSFDDAYDTARKRANLAAVSGHPCVRVVEGDVRDGVLLDGLLTSVPFDLVVHFAVRMPDRPALQDAGPCYDVNVAGTLALVEGMRRHHVSRLLLGSAVVPTGRGASRPTSPLAASRLSAELVSHVFHRLARASVLGLRYADVYGPRQRPDSEVARVWRAVSGRGSVVVPATGATWGRRDYLYVDDAVDAALRAVRRLGEQAAAEPMYEVVDVGSGTGTSREDLVATIAAAQDRRPRTRGSTGRMRDRESVVADPAPARELLGFSATVDLAPGIERLAAWLEEAEADRLVAQPTA